MKKIILSTYFFFLTLPLLAQDAWQPDLSSRLDLKLTYLKLAHVLPHVPSPNFLSFEEFYREIARLKAEADKKQVDFHPTLGQIKKFSFFRIEQNTEKTFRAFALTPDEVFQELIQELFVWKDKLSGHELPLAEVRERLALAYCKSLAEKSVQDFLKKSGECILKLPEGEKTISRSTLRHALLLPIATLIKSEPIMSIRAFLINVVLNYDPESNFGLFEGTLFEKDLLRMAISDPHGEIQEKMLNSFRKKDIPEFHTIVRQLAQKAPKQRIRELAKDILSELDRRPSLDADSDTTWAAASLGEPETENISEPIESSKELLEKLQRLQEEVLLTQVDLSIESQIDQLLSPNNTSKEVVLPLVRELIFNSDAHLYIRLLAAEFLFSHSLADIIPIVKEMLLSDLINEELKLKVLNVLQDQLPNELVSDVTHVICSPKDYAATIRRLAVKSLATVTDQPQSNDISNTLYAVAAQDPSETVRAEAFEAITTLDGNSCLSRIAEMIQEDPSDFVRWKGVEILKRFSKDKDVLRVLKTLAKNDPRTVIRIRSAEAFGKEPISLMAAAEEVEARRDGVQNSEQSISAVAGTLSDKFIDKMRDRSWIANHIVAALGESYAETFNSSPETARKWMNQNAKVLINIGRLRLKDSHENLTDIRPTDLRLILRRALRDVTRRSVP